MMCHTCTFTRFLNIDYIYNNMDTMRCSHNPPPP